MIITRLSINNIPIRLTEERWDHICDNHKLDAHKTKVIETITAPDIVYASPLGIRPQFIAIKAFLELEQEGLTSNLVVHYRELNRDGFVITAFTMSEKRLKKKVSKWLKVYPK